MWGQALSAVEKWELYQDLLTTPLPELGEYISELYVELECHNQILLLLRVASCHKRACERDRVDTSHWRSQTSGTS
jgi:hypothetical protein